jgi:hypothetical protein
MLWGIDDSGKLTGIPVTVGLSDGQKTEIISDKVSEGMKFLTIKGSVKQNTANTQRNFGPGRLF